MKQALRIASLSGLAMTTGCTNTQPNTFIFTADLPPGFAYQAVAVYLPAKGQTCTVPGGRNTEVGYNLEWRKSYQPNSKIALYRTVSGCPLVIYRVKLEINSAYGNDWGDISGDSAVVAIRDELEPRYTGAFNELDESVFYGQCQWLFRTAGSKRRIVKILDCKKTTPQGELGRGRPFSAYALDQLPGKTIKMKIKLASEEEPYFTGKWVKFKNGYKRCMGKSFGDQHAFCYGNFRDFSTFQMPDGRTCSVYPGCID